MSIGKIVSTTVNGFLKLSTAEKEFYRNGGKGINFDV